MKEKRVYINVAVCVFIATSITVIVNWLYSTFGNLTINEIIFQLKVPMKGTSTQPIWNFLM